MRLKGTRVVVVLSWNIVDLAGCRFGLPPDMPDIGRTQLANGAVVQADQRTLTEILDTFSRADEALRKQDLDTLMTIYSQSYKYHGYDKDRLRLVWKDLFLLHTQFSATHVFSKIVVNARATPPTAEITCAGSLWALSKLTGRRVNIDSWFGEVHHLIYEDGAWRIGAMRGRLRSRGDTSCQPIRSSEKSKPARNR
ncbi:MAG: hypothetical protein E6K68_00480 [Nitrospirae bacterium]|nr:MAG: hypothetical protein E6K68_00480 [Nitrospirota bacterium]